MQLTYRGISYNAAQTTGNTVDSGITATYRGLLYTVPRATDAKVMPLQTLRYRGIVIGESEVTYQPSARPAMA